MVEYSILQFINRPGVACRMSRFFLCFFPDKVVNLIGGESVINGAYPVYFCST